MRLLVRRSSSDSCSVALQILSPLQLSSIRLTPVYELHNHGQALRGRSRLLPMRGWRICCSSEAQR